MLSQKQVNFLASCVCMNKDYSLQTFVHFQVRFRDILAIPFLAEWNILSGRCVKRFCSLESMDIFKKRLALNIMPFYHWYILSSLGNGILRLNRLTKIWNLQLYLTCWRRLTYILLFDKLTRLLRSLAKRMAGILQVCQAIYLVQVLPRFRCCSHYSTGAAFTELYQTSSARMIKFILAHLSQFFSFSLLCQD